MRRKTLPPIRSYGASAIPGPDMRRRNSQDSIGGRRNSLTHQWLDPLDHKEVSPPLRSKSEMGMRSTGNKALDKALGAGGALGMHFEMPTDGQISWSKANTPLPNGFISSANFNSSLPSGFVGRRQERRRKEKLQLLVDGVNSNPRKARLVRRVIMSWQMAEHRRAVLNWQINIRQRGVLLQRLAVATPHMLHCVWSLVRRWALYQPLRVLAAWQRKMKRAKRMRMGRRMSVEEIEQAQQRWQFAQDFLHAVDTDGDGGLSLCELKAAEMTKDHHNPMFAKASIWLTNPRCGGNFKKYDKRGIGIIDEPDLMQAMEVFLAEYWKYDGVLW